MVASMSIGVDDIFTIQGCEGNEHLVCPILRSSWGSFCVASGTHVPWHVLNMFNDMRSHTCSHYCRFQRRLVHCFRGKCRDVHPELFTTESAELEISAKNKRQKHQEMPRARHLLRVPSSCRSWHWHNPTWWWCYLRPTAPAKAIPWGQHQGISRRQSNCDWATLFLCLELDSHDARKAFHYLILLSRADFSWDSIALTTPQCASLILGQTCTLPSCSKPHSKKCL